jgi:hypothetical protein
MQNDKKFVKSKRKLLELFHIPSKPVDDPPVREPSRQKFLEELGEYDQWRDEQIPKGSG